MTLPMAKRDNHTESINIKQDLVKFQEFVEHQHVACTNVLHGIAKKLD